MFGIGFGEIIIIALLALILFGQKDLSGNIRKAANGLKEFRRFSSDMQRSWHEVRNDMTRALLEESKTENSYVVANEKPSAKPLTELKNDSIDSAEKEKKISQNTDNNCEENQTNSTCSP